MCPESARLNIPLQFKFPGVNLPKKVFQGRNLRNQSSKSE